MTDYLLTAILLIMVIYAAKDLRAYFRAYGTPWGKWRRKRQARNR